MGLNIILSRSYPLEGKENWVCWRSLDSSNSIFFSLLAVICLINCLGMIGRNEWGLEWVGRGMGVEWLVRVGKERMNGVEFGEEFEWGMVTHMI